MEPTTQPRTSRMRSSPARLRRDGGYMLLAIMLMMAVMIIAATAAAPRVVQQMKRDREEEMIHRGTQYARAIKAFYKKNGRYPSSLDDLDKGQIKYLRQRYKDPLSQRWQVEDAELWGHRHPAEHSRAGNACRSHGHIGRQQHYPRIGHFPIHPRPPVLGSQHSSRNSSRVNNLVR